MAAPVWVLSVDLQTKTATFQTGLADAARTARDKFKEIKQDADEMGRGVGYSTGEARHAVMMLGEEFGAHLPRGLTTFIASLGPIGPALQAAFPFLAVALGATLLIEHLMKIHEAAEKAAEAQAQFGITADKALMGLDDKLLRAGIQMDELNDNHLAALKKELELIDHESLDELMSTFDIFAKSADAALAGLKTSWYQFGAGSAGAKHSLEEFKLQYDALLAKDDKEGALALLNAKVAREREILNLQQKAAAIDKGTGNMPDADSHSKYQAQLALQKMGVGFTEKEIEAQNTLTQALDYQLEANQKITAYEQAKAGYATAKTDKAMGADDDKKWKELGREAKQEADDAQRAWDEAYKAAVSKLQETEKEKIDATRQGSLQRLAAIDAAIKEERAKGLEETGFYKSLLTDRVNLTREMAEEQLRVTEELAKEEAEHDKKMASLDLKEEQERINEIVKLRKSRSQAVVEQEIAGEEAEYQAQLRGYQKELAALDKNGKDHEVKLKQIQDRELELTKEHEDKLAQIRIQAEEEQDQRILSARQHADDMIAASATKVLTGQESAGKALIGIGREVAAGMMENAIKSVLANNFTKESDAAAAARKAFLAGEQYPWPMGTVMGPLLGAMAFASVMAFNEGGIVKGTGGVDSVPARLTPGEAVLPKRLTENLTNAGNSSGSGKSGDVHYHNHSVNNLSALDSDGMSQVLERHADVIEQHVDKAFRRRGM